MVGNAGNFFAWVFLYMIGVLLIIAGIQGSAGRMLAVALCPNKLDVVSQTEGLFPGLPNVPGIQNPYGIGTTSQAVYV